MDIHERVKAICKEQGLLFKELAKKIGITEIGLRQALKGKPSLTTLEKVSTALGIKVWELLIEEETISKVVCPHCGKELKIKIEIIK